VAAKRAREVAQPDDTAPFGFAARATAAAAGRRPAPVPLEVVCGRLTWRCLAGMAAVLVVCAAIEGPHWRDQKPLDPGIENTVAQLVWAL
jgi:hypothetical protein